MSYNQNPYGGNHPNQPPAQYPPQQGYGPPGQQPPGQYYPQQPPYGQQQGSPPGQYNHPPQGYPPQQQGYPPQNQGWQHQNPPPPSQGHYGAPSPQPPPQGHYGAPSPQPPSQGHYGGPPPQGASQGYYGGGPPQPASKDYYGGQQSHQSPHNQGPAFSQGYPPQQAPYPGMQQPPAQQGPYQTPPQPYGYAPPQQQHQVIPAPPSFGYNPDQKAHGDVTHEADALRKAMKGWGTDEEALINILTKPDPLQMALIRQTYVSRHGRSLEKDLESETSGDFEDGLLALALGPLGSDVAHLNDALSRIGTSETSLNDVLLGRSNADLKAIKISYAETYKKSLESHIKSDLSGKTERLFLMILAATRPEEGTYFDTARIDTDVSELYHATESQKGTDEIAVCAVFCNTTDSQLRAISQAYASKYHRSLEKVVRDEFTSHMEDALLFMLAHAENPVRHQAAILRACLGSSGTIDGVDTARLVYWLARLHFAPAHFEAVKKAFRDLYSVDLRTRVRALLPPGHVGSLVVKLVG